MKSNEMADVNTMLNTRLSFLKWQQMERDLFLIENRKEKTFVTSMVCVWVGKLTATQHLSALICFTLKSSSSNDKPLQEHLNVTEGYVTGTTLLICPQVLKLNGCYICGQTGDHHQQTFLYFQGQFMFG